MARPARKILFDKDIRELEIKPKYYKRAVGNPKELYIIVYPSGMKTFSLKIDDDNFMKIRTFRAGFIALQGEIRLMSFARFTRLNNLCEQS